MAEEEKYISGIFNYCDRWCERCAYTDRCRTFAMEQEQKRNAPAEEQEDFWDIVGGNLADTMEMLREKASELGIDLDALEEITETEEREKREENAARRHPLMLHTRDYSLEVERWMSDKYVEIQALIEELNNRIAMGAGAKQALHSGSLIKESVEVIKWYQFFIEPKLYRALSQKNMAEEDDQDMEEDAQGSAKVALIAMDRSVSAWHVLLEELPDAEDDIFGFMLLLNGIRRITEAEFPKAYDFIRPGFDE